MESNDARSQPNFAQGPDDVVDQHNAIETSGAMMPHLSPDHLADVQGRYFCFNVEHEQAPQIGDTNIHTTGSVHNAPVYQQHITQNVTVHQTYEQAHCSSELPVPLYIDQETAPKLPGSSPSTGQTFCPSKLIASYYFDEETSPKLPATSHSSEQAHCPSQLASPHSFHKETSTKLPAPSCSSTQSKQFATYQQPQSKLPQVISAVISQLKQRAEELASEVSSLADFSERPIPTVNLTIVNRPQQIDDEFRVEKHYHRRKKPKLKHYDGTESEITCEKMFSLAKEAAQNEADEKFKLIEVKAKQNYVKKHGNVVGVVGQAGIGKTTTAKTWAMQALRRELFGETSFFFYIVIRHIDFTREMTLLEFLLSTMSIEQDYNPQLEESILNAIRNDANAMMIFDGFDEAAFKSFSDEVPQPLLHKKSKAENYLKHLAGGNLLPRARKIFTSRPSQLYKLHPSYRPRFIVQILGLTPTSQNELGLQICGDKYDDIQQKLEQNRNVFAYCYVPVNFILTLSFLMNYKGDIQFVSLTRVLAVTCGQYLTTNHLRGQEGELDKLAKLAYDAFLNMEIVFKAMTFVKAGIKESTADAFTNMSVTRHGNLKLTILDGHKVRYFSHLIWQEFFAGFYLMMIMPFDEFKKVYKHLADDRWEVVSKFVFGITDNFVFEELRRLVPENSSLDWKQKKSLLSKFIKSKPTLSSDREIFRVCSWAHETNDSEIASSVSSLLPDQLNLQKSHVWDLPLLPVDLYNLSMVVHHRRTPLKRLDLSYNKIGISEASSLARCLHNIAELHLEGCRMDCESVERLCAGVKKPMEVLRLRRNNLTDECAESLSKCVRYIKVLDVSRNSFSEAGEIKIRSESRENVKF